MIKAADLNGRPMKQFHCQNNWAISAWQIMGTSVLSIHSLNVEHWNKLDDKVMSLLIFPSDQQRPS